MKWEVFDCGTGDSVCVVRWRWFARFILLFNKVWDYAPWPICIYCDDPLTEGVKGCKYVCVECARDLSDTEAYYGRGL